MSPKTRTLLLAFALLGLGAAIWSSFVHYRLLTQPGYTSVCDINATVSCTQAYLSPYGSFRGIPVALLGVVFFVLMLLLVGLAGAPGSSVRENAAGYVFAASTIGLAFVLYLAWASFFVLKAFCVLCAITYVAVIAMFIISGGAVSFPMTNLPGRAVRDSRRLLTSPFALLITVLFLGGAAFLVTAFPHESAAATANTGAQQSAAVRPLTDQQRSELERWWAVQQPEDVPVPRDGAKVLIVKFSDFQCPACKAAHDAYKPIVAKYPRSDVKYVLKHFPLEPECNAGAPGGNHFASCESAAATVMAGANFDKMKDWLFANQTKLTPGTVKQAAKDVVGISDFDARYANALQSVRGDADLGVKMKIRSTPTFFINGRRLEGGPPPQYFDALIQLELKK